MGKSVPRLAGLLSLLWTSGVVAGDAPSTPGPSDNQADDSTTISPAPHTERAGSDGADESAPADSGTADASDATGAAGDWERPEYWTATGSLLAPGLGQAADARWLPAVGFAGAAAGGIGLVASSLDEDGEMDPGDPKLVLGSLLFVNAAGLSAYDAYRHRTLDRVPEASSVGEILTGPLHVRALTDGWVSVPLGALTLASGAFVPLRLAKSDRAAFEDVSAGEVGLVAVVGTQAAIWEEAVFRGFLLSYLDEARELPFWLANTIQASAFGAVHYVPTGDWRGPSRVLFAGGFGAVLGHITRRHDYDLRPAVLTHFAWNAIVLTCSLAAGEGCLTGESLDDGGVVLPLPLTIGF